MSSFPQVPDTPGPGLLSVLLISPDEQRRRDVAAALYGGPIGLIREYASYPANLDELPRILEQNCDVVVVDLDPDPEYALLVVESIYSYGTATVIVCSAKANLELAVRCMRAGAREFLTLPLDRATVTGALSRISVRGHSSQPARRTARKVFVFLGAKGGVGVTTIAANFAVSVAQESSQSTLLIDLGLPLGDAALNLGMVTEYSTVNAVENPSRLDASFLSTLLAKHVSGLSVLAAPSEFATTEASLEAIDRLLGVARQNFDYVIVDAGTRMDLKDAKFLDDSAVLYLVTQIGVTELRNSNRMIVRFFVSRGSKLQVVVNRYTPQSLLLDDRAVEKALTRSIDWKIPDDYAAARRTQNAATPLAMEDSPISRAIRRMARKACGLSEEDEKGSRAGLFGWARRGFTKSRPSDESADAKDDNSPSLGSAPTLGANRAKS
ncbi:MAG TPA: AAA family ATPase [Terracidiphilus sp.]|jgi:pilus assembly protein CpaE|nr:AAA family ATPase [Terracidiphilus sp.]